MMQAYFDESGTHHGSPVVCVAGYLFSEQQALHIDREWAEALRDFGISHFHAVDCAHGKKEFSLLTKQRSTDLLVRLIGIIKRRAEFGVAVTVSETDFGQLDAPGVWGAGGPYVICAAQVLSAVVAWADKFQYRGKISYFFERGHRHQEITNRVIRQFSASPNLESALRYWSHTFEQKKTIRPLQAADLLAYEWTKELIRINVPQNTRRPMRRSLESLLDLTHLQQHFKAEHIQMFADGGFGALVEHTSKFNIVE